MQNGKKLIFQKLRAKAASDNKVVANAVLSVMMQQKYGSSAMSKESALRAQHTIEKQAFMGALLKALGSARSAVGAIPGAMKTYGRNLSGSAVRNARKDLHKRITGVGPFSPSRPLPELASQIGKLETARDNTRLITGLLGLDAGIVGGAGYLTNREFNKESALRAQHTIEKQAFMGALLKALGSARSAVGAVPGALKTYGKRMMGNSTLKPLQQRADLINDLGWTGAESKLLERHHEDALRAITKERASIDMARNLTAGGTAVGAIGAAGLGAHHAMNKESGVLGSALKLLASGAKGAAKGIYNTPTALKTLAAGGAGGYAYGHDAGQTAGVEQGKAEAAKTLTDLLTNSGALGKTAALMALYPTEKQAFLNALLQGGKLAAKGVGDGLSSYLGALSGEAAGISRAALSDVERTANKAWAKTRMFGSHEVGPEFREQVYWPAQRAFDEAKELTEKLEFKRDLARRLTGAGAGIGAAGLGVHHAMNKESGALGKTAALMALYPTEKQAFLNALLQGGKLALQGGKLAAKGIGSGISASLPYVQSGIKGVGNALSSYGSALSGQAAGAARKALPGLEQAANNAWSQSRKLGPGGAGLKFTENVLNPARQAFTNGQALTQNLEFNRNLARGLTGAGAAGVGGTMALKSGFDDNKKDKRPPKAKDLVNMESAGGAIADAFSSSMWGGERAGRTQAMADAMGEDTTFGVRHPLTQSLGYGSLGALLGGAAGAATGYGVGSLDTSNENNSALGGIIGGGLGGLSGLFGGISQAGHVRRNEMQRINHFYDQDVEKGTLNPKMPKFSLLSALLLPDRGPHRVGQLEAVRAMQGGPAVRDQRGLRDAMYAARFIPKLGLPLQILHGYGQNIRTQLANESDPEEQKNPERRPKRSKAAAYKSAVYPPSVATQNWTARVAAHDRAMAAKQKGTAKEITPNSETSSDAASFLPRPTTMPMRPMPNPIPKSMTGPMRPMTRPLPVRKPVSAIQSGSETSPDAASFFPKSSASAQLGKAAALAVIFKLAGEMGQVSQAGNAVANSPSSRPGLNTGSMRGGVLTGVNGQAQKLSPRQQESVDAATQMGNDFMGMNPSDGGAGRGGPRMQPSFDPLAMGGPQLTNPQPLSQPMRRVQTPITSNSPDGKLRTQPRSVPFKMPTLPSGSMSSPNYRSVE